MLRTKTITLIAIGLSVGLLSIWTAVEGRASASAEPRTQRSSGVRTLPEERAARQRQRAVELGEKALEAQREQIDKIRAEGREAGAGTGALHPAPRGSQGGSLSGRTPSFDPSNRSLSIDGDLDLAPSSNVSKGGDPWLWDDDTGNLGAGLNALGSTSGGSYNTAFGYYALYGNADGYNNSALGAFALEQNEGGKLNSAFGFNALSHNTSGSRNNALGFYALLYNTTGANNIAVGNTALMNNQGGPYPQGSQNTAVGANSLFSNTIGVGNVAVGLNALASNTDGSFLTAVGKDALTSNTTVVGPSYTYRGLGNTALGSNSLENNTTGSFNTATGYKSLNDNETGSENTATGWMALEKNTNASNSAFGSQALRNNSSGYANTAIGTQALYSNTNGYSNTAVGYYALKSLTGYGNIAIGANAGNTTPSVGDLNILIGNRGLPSDNYTIRLGTQGTQTLTYVAGILGTPGLGAADFFVHVTPEGQLVQGSPVTVSSRRFKRDIRDMGEASEKVAELRPVTFRFTEELERGSPGIQYGLIAEEVAEFFPQLVEYDDQGRPYTVRYQLLTPLLLNELRRQAERVRRLEARLAMVERKGR